MVTGVFHSAFTVSNLKQSIEFYRDRLGMEVVMEQHSDAPYISQLVGFPAARLNVAYLRVPGDKHVLELVEYVEPKGGGSPLPPNAVGSAHLCFYVANLNRAYETLRKAGVEFVSPPVDIAAGTNEGARGVYFHDPDGFTLELHQPRDAR
jgi:catechol 2,3-dioxygenase-like lactoylglutathione lyase family enzyme